MGGDSHQSPSRAQSNVVFGMVGTGWMLQGQVTPRGQEVQVTSPAFPSCDSAASPAWGCFS